MIDAKNDQVTRILDSIKSASRILLHFHPSPDPDSICSALAMANVLRSLSKTATVISGDSGLPEWVGSLPGAETIEAKNYSQINQKDFDLFIILDSSTPSQISKLTEVTFLESMTTIVIDHHISNTGFGGINLVDHSYPAASALLADLFFLWGVKVSKDTASLLMLGIYADSGGFIYPSTSSETFRAASKLAAICPDYHKLIFDFENSQTPERLKFLGLALSNIHTYFSGKVAISEITLDQLKAAGLSKKDSEKADVSNYLKSVVGWELGISFFETEPQTINLSFRTRNAEIYDVSKIATTLGGGGHKAASGAEIKANFAQAKYKLLESLKITYPGLGEI